MTVEKGRGSRILVVEDEALIAFDIADALEGFGCEVIGPVSTLERAFKVARSGELDGAILDVTVRGGKTYPVAEELLSRGIPFLFASGHDDWALPTAMRAHPRLTKPFTRAELEAQLRFLGIEIAKQIRDAQLADVRSQRPTN